MRSRNREPRLATASTIRRDRDLVAVLVRHGLADIVDALHLTRYVAWGTRLLPGQRHIDPSLSRAARIRLTLEELGPTFIKFGQALSVRADLLPPDLISELVKLQDQTVPLVPGVAEAAVAAELGQPVSRLFASFEHAPLASASIAQVHRAVLLTGEPVVVKVRRPGIGELIASDIEILLQMARLVERHVPALDIVDPVELVEEFARSIRAELDLAREARSIERCAANFTGDTTVRFPRVYRELTTSGVLTLEWLDGIKISSLDAVGAGPYVKQLVARRGADAMLAQVLVHGFFHADPHPGNILVLEDHVIGFLDFGIVGRLDERRRNQLARVVRSIWIRDIAELTSLALEITEPRGEVNRQALERDLGALVETYGDVPIGEMSATDVLTDIVRTAARHHLRMPASLMVLIKALITIEGVGVQLDPSFRMVEHAAPLTEQLWRKEFTPEAIGRRLVGGVRETLSAIHALPLHLDAIGRKARDGRLEVRFVHKNLDHFVQEMDRSSNRIAFALIIAALIVGSSFIIQIERGPLVYGYPVLGLIGFLVAGLFGVGLAIAILRSGRL
ncbi:MAG: phosphotransferase [Acidobacteria bacterium]|nr:phosphotransferase [Acidobacteriota bacterium]